jgi:hypothetical protein
MTETWQQEPVCSNQDAQISCRCRDAVQRAYRQMVATGASYADAHMVAARVYRHHHPDAAAANVNRLVGRLIAAPHADAPHADAPRAE